MASRWPFPCTRATTTSGGQWSDERFRAHCEKNIEQDFASCFGFFTTLKGNAFDPLKIWAARRVIDWRFSDATVHSYRDPRITAAVAMVPFAVDFIPESLAKPAAQLGLVIARKDVNQVPRFHVEGIAKACTPNCEVVMDLPEGSHGAMLSPMPPLERGSVGEQLLADPPSFDRAQAIAELNERWRSSSPGISRSTTCSLALLQSRLLLAPSQVAPSKRNVAASAPPRHALGKP